MGINKGDGIRYNEELYGYGYGSTFTLPASFKYIGKVTRTFWKTFNVSIENVDPTIDKFEITVDINLKLRLSGVKWHMVTLEIWEDNALAASSTMTRVPGIPTVNIVTGDPILYRFHVTKSYVLKIHFNGAANAVGSSPTWVLFDWPDDDHSAMPNWDMTRPGLGNHDDYWRELFNINHGGVTQTRTLTVDPQRFFWDHVVDFTAQASDPGSDDLTFTYYSSTQIAPISGPRTYFNNGVGPEPVAPPMWTPFTGTTPFVVNDPWTWTYTGGQTITLVVDDDDGGWDTKSLVIP
jgi:hypothetical protein